MHSVCKKKCEKSIRCKKKEKINMANKSKQKGSAYETALVNLFNKSGFRAQRLVLAGANDMGDIELFIEKYIYVIEAKNHKKLTPKLLKEFKQQTLKEQVNYLMSKASELDPNETIPLLIVKNHGTSILNSDVWFVVRAKEKQKKVGEIYCYYWFCEKLSQFIERQKMKHGKKTIWS
jgi:Holliday junction resolvase